MGWGPEPPCKPDTASVQHPSIGSDGSAVAAAPRSVAVHPQVPQAEEVVGSALTPTCLRGGPEACAPAGHSVSLSDFPRTCSQSRLCRPRPCGSESPQVPASTPTCRAQRVGVSVTSGALTDTLRTSGSGLARGRQPWSTRHEL